MRKPIDEYSDEPIYNMKAVEQQTGISAATLRAWERRYALIEPKRTQTGYRLYSERDVALLRWVRTQMNEGLTVSRVVAMLQSLRDSHESIYVDGNGDEPSLIANDAAMPPGALVAPLYDALINLDADRADEIMEQAFAMYTMPTVYVEIITPTLVRIGEAWHRGNLLISTEHFASAYLRGRLTGLLQTYPQRLDMPMIFVGCAPTERHEVGALIFAVMLRQQGYNVVYLGQDIPIEDIVEAAAQEHPVMICLSAARESSAVLLLPMQELLNQSEPPIPVFGYGGRAFDQNPELRNTIVGYYLGPDPRDAVGVVNNLVRSARSV
jgi:methanogenic corrinoid protein MtbC1